MERCEAGICYNASRRCWFASHRTHMDERAFYSEREETKKIKLVCPHCRKDFEFPVRWKVCMKRKELPRGAGEEG